MTLEVNSVIQTVALSVLYGEAQCTLTVNYTTPSVVLQVAQSATDFQARQNIQSLEGRVEELENDEHIIFNTLPPLQ